MSESAVLLSAFVHGIAAGAMIVASLAVLRSNLNPHMRTAALLGAISIVAWLFSESPELSRAAGDPRLLFALNYPAAGLFWLYVLAIFADLRVTPLTLAPAAFLLVSGIAMGFTPPPLFDLLWGVRNIAGALLALHAGTVIVRDWRDDLVEDRRRFRAVMLGAACLFVLVEVGAGFAHRFDPNGPWLLVVVGRPYGGLLAALLTVSLSLMLVQPRLSVFGASRRAEPIADSRAEAADRQLAGRLEGLMAAEAWRREGLTIGDLAQALETPEHRLRRLINRRLGYRNFADFLNGRRIEAAKRRLGDPAEARTTVAAIAFDLGFGSLGPFNRAFRAATGATPTEWRRQVLAGASPKLQDTG